MASTAATASPVHTANEATIPLPLTQRTTKAIVVTNQEAASTSNPHTGVRCEIQARKSHPPTRRVTFEDEVRFLHGYSSGSARCHTFFEDIRG